MCLTSILKNLQAKRRHKPSPCFHESFETDKLKIRTESQKGCKTYARKGSVLHIFKSITYPTIRKQLFEADLDSLCFLSILQKVSFVVLSITTTTKLFNVFHLLKTTRGPS